MTDTPQNPTPKAPQTLNAKTLSPRQLEEVRQNLFNRPTPTDYLAEWEERVASPTPAPACDQLSVLVFHVAGLWLAADVGLLVEITEPRPIHRVPHRTNTTFMGVVNIRGQMRLCGSLTGLMKVTSEETPAQPQTEQRKGHAFPRMIVLSDTRGPWVFPVDEVVGVARIVPADIAPAPVTVTRGFGSLTKGVINWQNRRLGYIDAQLLFSSLNRSLT